MEEDAAGNFIYTLKTKGVEYSFQYYGLAKQFDFKKFKKVIRGYVFRYAPIGINTRFETFFGTVTKADQLFTREEQIEILANYDMQSNVTQEFRQRLVDQFLVLHNKKKDDKHDSGLENNLAHQKNSDCDGDPMSDSYYNDSISKNKNTISIRTYKNPIVYIASGLLITTGMYVGWRAYNHIYSSVPGRKKRGYKQGLCSIICIVSGLGLGGYAYLYNAS